MSNKLTAEVTAWIRATPQEVWNALTQPELIRQYFFGTEAISDWKVGSTLHFKGEWEGKPYLDKGFILASEPNQLFRYSYWSAFSGMPDVPENYAEITYALSPKENGTELRVIQNGIPDEARKKHSEENWRVVIEGLRKIVQKEQ